MEQIKAVLVENLERPHRMYRRLLERLDDVVLIGAFYYPEQLLKQLDQGLRPDIVVMDVRMDDSLTDDGTDHFDGIEAARRIRMRFPKMPIILYSMWDNPEYYRRIEEARFGMRYAFVKRYSLDDWDRLGEIVRRVWRGETHIDPEVRVEMDLLKERGKNSPLVLLEDDDQRKVLALLADGLSNDEIARTLARKPRWVEEIVKQIYELLWLTNEGSGDSRRIRAARMFHEDRVLRWEPCDDGSVALLAQDRHGEWRRLEDIKCDEEEAVVDAKVINNAIL